MRLIAHCISLLLLISLGDNKLIAQDTYTVSWGMEEYTPLEDYFSMYEVVNLGSGLGSDSEFCLGTNYILTEIGLNFDFPFYDQVLTRATPIPTGNIIFDLYNSSKQIAFFFARVEDANCPDGPLLSDFRVQRGIKDGLKFCAFEMVDGVLQSDVVQGTVLPHHTINFQVWLYENGTIQFRAGDINVEGSPNYVPGVGFIRRDSVPEGPHLGIQSWIQSDEYFILGSFENPEIINEFDFGNRISGLPEKGWTATWTYNNFTSTKEAEDEVPYEHQTLITTGIVEDNHDLENWILVDLNGNPYSSGGPYESIDLSNAPAGMYVLSWQQQRRRFSRKVIKL